MSISTKSTLRNFFICILLISLKLVLLDLFVDIKKLNLHDSFFVVLNSGLYLYDFNTMDCSIILEFNSTVYKSSDNKVNLTDLYDEKNSFIFCSVNEYLFIFNEKNNRTYSYQVKEITNIINIGGYYNLMPYKYEVDKISFIIAYYSHMDQFLYFYYYNFSLNDGINEPKTSTIAHSTTDNMIRCQIIPNYSSIKCFYFYLNSNNQNYLKSIEFTIKKEITIQSTWNSYAVNNTINQIKLTKAYNNNLFICILIKNTPKCYINIDSKNELKDIDCEHKNYWYSTYKILYFNETGNFLFASGMHLTTTILNNFNFSVSICQKDIFCDQNTTNTIVYNNGYKFVNDYNFTNYEICTNISIPKEEEIKSPGSFDIYNSEIENEYSQVLKIIKGLNIFDLNKTMEMVFPFEDKIFRLSSTFMENINQNKNITTINLGKCEIELKNRYNISNESNLYILKIDSEKKGMNFPIIEYEVYFPLKNETLEKLNLSFCEGIKIEISYPINLNDDFDKYDPKSKYYNDICSNAKSEDGTDITLTDRRNEFLENNMSLCENNCIFIEYDNINKKVKCSCNVKPLLSFDFIELDKDILMKNFLDINKITNIEIIKCYKNVFNKKNIISNYGSLIIVFIFILFIICLIIFYSKSLNKLIKEINEIIKAKKNMKKNKANKNKINNNYNSNQPRNIIINNISSNKRIKKNKTKSKAKKKEAKSSSRKIIQENIIKTNNKKVKKGNKHKKNRIQRNISNINKIINKKLYEKNKKILEYNETELNSLSYNIALNQDKRTYGQYYFSLLKEKQLLIFSFYPNKDYNSRIIKIFLFFYFFSSNLAINALFFTDNTMHKIYIDSGSFNLYYQLPQIIYSSLISGIINTLIKFLSLSSKTVTQIKTMKINEKDNSDKNIINKMKIKLGFFFVISFILLLGFWYYISCFCAVYENTQIHLIKDSVISFGLSLIYPFFINLIPVLFRIPALKAKKGDKECLYKFSNILAIF